MRAAAMCYGAAHIFRKSPETLELPVQVIPD